MVVPRPSEEQPIAAIPVLEEPGLPRTGADVVSVPAWAQAREAAPPALAASPQASGSVRPVGQEQASAHWD